MLKRTPFTGTLVCAAALCGIFATAILHAADMTRYPERPIRLIVPQGIGAGTDLLARPFAVKFGEALGQQIVVDNRPGRAA